MFSRIEQAKEKVKLLKELLKNKLIEKKGEILKILKGERKPITEKKAEVNILLRFLIPSLILLQAFYPASLQFLPFYVGVSLIVGVVALILLLVFGGISIARGFRFIPNILIGLATVLIILIIAPTICKILIGKPSPNYYEVLRRMGTIKLPPFPDFLIRAEDFVFILSGLSLLLCWLIGYKIKSFGGFFIYSILLLLLFHVGGSFILSSPAFAKYFFPWKVSTFFEREIIEEIPTEGGIEIRFGREEVTPPKIMAASPYYYYFSIKNNYEDSVEVKLHPYIEILYKSIYLKFHTDEFSLTIEEDPTPIERSLIFRPEEMRIEIEGCRHSLSTLIKYWGVEKEEIECASDKPCEKGTCVQIMSFLCECLDWTKATCKGSQGRIGFNFEHTGFLRGKATLHYGEKYEKIPTQKFTQGPLSIYAIFYPNPWIDKYYREYQPEVILRLEAEGSGEITIKDVKVNSVSAKITTNIQGYSEELNGFLNLILVESVNLTKKECKLILPEERPLLKGRGRILIYECKFKPPQVKLLLKEKKLNLSATTEINYNEIKNYCERKFEEELSGMINPEIAEEIAKTLEKSSLCKITEGEIKGVVSEEKLEEKEIEDIIKNSLKAIDVGFEIKYVRKSFTQTYWTEINKNVPACL